MQLFQEARELIEIESISGNEAPAVDYLARKAREMGLEVRREAVEPNRDNLMVGPENPRVLFCTHTDTVPPYVPFREDEEYLWGRGACDTKGISACFLEAGRRLLDRGFRDFGYLWVIGEEVGNIGAQKANRTVRCGHLIVGEPTRNQLATGHKGCLGGTIRARGRAAHSAYPERGASAIHRLLDALERLRRADLGHDDVLGEATLNVGFIEGGVAANVLAPQAEANVLIRLVTGLDDTTERLQKALFAADGAREWLSFEPNLEMDRMHATVLDGFDTTVVAYGTDLPFLRDVGKPYLLGPGDILDAHTDHERISRREMRDAVDLYVDLALRLAG